jgi:hypothetical protein
MILTPISTNIPRSVVGAGSDISRTAEDGAQPSLAWQVGKLRKPPMTAGGDVDVGDGDVYVRFREMNRFA